MNLDRSTADLTLQLASWMTSHQLGRAVPAPVVPKPPPAPLPTRYMDAHQCASYIGRTLKALYCLVERGHIPHSRPGRKLQFDPERIDAWMGRHARRGKLLVD